MPKRLNYHFIAAVLINVGLWAGFIWRIKHG